MHADRRESNGVEVSFDKVDNDGGLGFFVFLPSPLFRPLEIGIFDKSLAKVNAVAISPSSSIHSEMLPENWMRPEKQYAVHGCLEH